MRGLRAEPEAGTEAARPERQAEGEGRGMIEDLARRLAEALRDVLAADPDLSGYAETMEAAEAVLSEAQAAGLLEPDA